jgi:hypothetical protein
MPYIKYYGGRSPNHISERVSYDYRGANCREGLAALTAAAARHAEEVTQDPVAQARLVEQYISDREYPGRTHVGGVGMVEDQHIRSSDIVISPEEYRTLSAEIKNANDAARVAEAESLSRQNNPLQEAREEHERLGWRTRVWVRSYTILEHHVPYAVGESCIAYLRVRQQDASGFTLQLIDLYHASSGDIGQALLEGLDWAERVVDNLSLLGYGAARVERVVGTAPPTCRLDQGFEVATFGAWVRNEPVHIPPGQFPALPPNAEAMLSLRHLRDGLSAPLLTGGIAAFWNALEALAERFARALDLRRIAKCKVCGAERTVGWDLRSGFHRIYADAGLDPAAFDVHRKARGTVQHGDKHPTTGLIAELLPMHTQLQTAAIVAVAEATGLKPQTRVYLSTSWPVLVLQCAAHADGSFSSTASSVSGSVVAGMIPQRWCGEASRAIEFGVALPVEPDPLVFPRVIGSGAPQDS